MQYEGKGIPTVDLSVPTRYTHTPVETCSMSDVRQLSDLSLALMRDLPADLDLARG